MNQCCRIRYCTQDIVVFREDLHQKLHRSALLTPNHEQTEADVNDSDYGDQVDISKHVCQSMLAYALKLI